MSEGQCLPHPGESHAHNLSFRTKSCVGFLDCYFSLQGTTVVEAWSLALGCVNSNSCSGPCPAESFMHT